ncbi:MAG: NAD(P)-dependent oxidoreductase [Pseudomonadota bacterium]
MTQPKRRALMRAGVIGLGDMGSGLALNLIKNGFHTTGFDIDAVRLKAFGDTGGTAVDSVAGVGSNSDAVFVMVMNGDQAKEVILGDQGLVATMPKGGIVILSATIKPAEAVEIGQAMQGSDIELIDTPVSGGYPGAQGGTLTMMAAGNDAAMEVAAPVMQAVSKTIHRVGDKPGDGQVMKACLQSLIGAIFSATFEAASLAAKAGVKGETLFNVFSTSGAGCGVSNSALENIIDRQFEGTGSHINTMYKDLTISLDFAQQLGVPMQTAATAMQIFQAGKTRYPNGDNWVCTRVLEEIVGAELHR